MNNYLAIHESFRMTGHRSRSARRCMALLLILSVTALVLPGAVTAQYASHPVASRLAAQPPAVSRLVPGLRIISSDSRGIEMELEPVFTLERTAEGYLLPFVSNGILLNSRAVGEPMMMRVVIPVALPGPTGNRLEVLGADYGDPQSAKVAPVPQLSTDRDGMTRTSYVIDAAKYASWAPANDVATMGYTGLARDVYSGSIGINAYRYDGARSELRLLKRVRLRLTYASPPAAARAGASALSELTRNAFVNSDVASRWAVPANARPLERRAGGQTARAWMRVEVKEDGLYALTADDFHTGGIDLSTVDPSRIAVYGGDGGELPEGDLAIDSAKMHQVPAIVEQSGGKATRVLFYGVGPNRWGVPRGDSVPKHHINPYVNAVGYMIAVDGDPSLSFPVGGTAGTPGTTLRSGIARLYFEEDRLNAVDIRKSGGSGRDWFGTVFQVDPSRPADPRVFQLNLPGLDHSQPVYYRVRAANAGLTTGSDGAGTFLVEQGSASLGNFTIDGVGGDRIAMAKTGTYVGKGADIGADNNSLLKITYSNGVAASGYLDWYEIHYTRDLASTNDQITFWSPSGSGIASFEARNFSSGDLLGFDVTDAANPRQLQNQVNDGRFVFTDQLSAAAGTRHYFIAARSAARKVSNVTSANVRGLRDQDLSVDVLVITHGDFKDAAQKYVDHRNAHGMRAAYVTVDDIYNEFSSGNLDPTAIRNYIAWAFHHWTTKPSYVVLMGDGSYDYRNIVTQQKPFIPPYESDDGDVYDHIGSTCFDDYYVRVTLDATQTIDLQADIAIGRMPVQTADQAATVVNKVIRYETTKNFGLWRATFALAADDDYPLGDGGGFTRQSESLWASLPNWVEPKKIYVAAYPTEQISARRKPGAEQDLQQSIDRGVVLTNWVGHGNPNVWAHEYILEKDQFIPALTNDSMLTYVPAVTCNFGYFDDPTVVSGAELFVLHPTGGAIAVMTATRSVYIGPNEELMRQHFRVLLARDPSTQLYPTIGQALMVTKFGRAGYADNDQKFLLLGDPALRLNLPEDSVEITSVNSVHVDTGTVQVGALAQVTIEGVVRDYFGRQLDNFDGTAIVSLYDADRLVKMETGEDTPTVTYYGGRLFRGPANVRGGHFSVVFRVPKDIAFDTTHGRIHVYAYNQDHDAAGMTGNVRVFGSDTTTVTDTVGPRVKIFLDDRSFSSGDVVGRDPMLIVDLADGSGINASGSSIGHRIEAWVDGSARSVDLTDTYQTLPTNYAEGSAEHQLTGLDPGVHTVRVRAWDIYNNPSEATAEFRISEDGDSVLKVEDVVNYPNPMVRETDFVFRHNQTAGLDVDIAIYTTSGRKVRELRQDGVNERFVRVHWDGRDADGHELANGVYLYRLRVKVSGDTSGREFETIDKVAIVK
ncbi:MAG: type IX secretion system sortase PorU [Bacteroidetes bacterium]|nr:type IX secretion system sortase PorU [Bacteroidota bacterium]